MQWGAAWAATTLMCVAFQGALVVITRRAQTGEVLAEQKKNSKKQLRKNSAKKLN